MATPKNQREKILRLQWHTPPPKGWPLPPKKDSKMSKGLCEAPPPPIPSLRASSPYWSYKSRFSGSLKTSYACASSLNCIPTTVFSTSAPKPRSLFFSPGQNEWYHFALRSIHLPRSQRNTSWLLRHIRFQARIMDNNTSHHSHGIKTDTDQTKQHALSLEQRVYTPHFFSIIHIQKDKKTLQTPPTQTHPSCCQIPLIPSNITFTLPHHFEILLTTFQYNGGTKPVS